MSQPAEKAPRVPDLGRFRIGEWEVQQAENALCSDERTLRLEPRMMDVLVSLAADAGRVVTKEALLAAVWEGAFVEEGALTQVIHALRKALGDDARQPRYIQTIPKRGYRLIAPVELASVEPAEQKEGHLEPAPPPLAPMAPVAIPVLRAAERRGRARVRLAQAAAVLMAALVLWIAWARHEAKVKDKEIRIAVLPFENLGEPQDPFFAAGLTEEITANLTLVPGIQVIPGRNALDAQGRTRPIEDLEDELGADYLLLGKVSWRPGRRQVRVTIQLTRVADDTLVPAAPVEGDADRPFAAQQAISRSVITALEVTLTPEQSEGIGRRSTENPEAYRAYVQGIVFKEQPFYSPENLEKAAQSFNKAVEIDPDFAEAWAELSQVHSYLAFNTDRSIKRKEQARHAMERAVALGPDLVATRLAQAFFHYRCLNDYTAALQDLDAAVKIAPNLAVIHDTRGLLLRRLGQLPDAIKEFKRALASNPRSAEQVWTLAETYAAVRQYEDADRNYQRAIDLAPDEQFYYEQQARVRLAWNGHLGEARAVLEASPVRDTPAMEMAVFFFDLYEHKYQQALTRLSSPEERSAFSPADQIRLSVFKVLALERLGRSHDALVLAEENLKVLQLRTAQYSRHPLFTSYLALTLAQLGRREEAIAKAAEAVEQGRYDAFSGPWYIEIQAMVDARLGRRQEAIAHLQWLLSHSYRDPMSVPELRVDPVWEPLRGDPAFEALLR
jgi:DNA-binding winged helix-turn-helix (wHTH) protein/tetratricopeptide (TPR) repeat protein/TolB-like protein